ncbi:MAG: HupE/UreJ family protein [Nevskiales bacterium]
MSRGYLQAFALALLLAVLLAGLWPTAQAHPLAPALLDLHEISAARYAVLWRTSVARAQGVDVLPQLPADCHALTTAQVSAEENQSLVQRWQIQCGPQGLTGRTLGVAGLDRSRVNVILRIETLAGDVSTTLLDAERPTYSIPAPQAGQPVFGTYLELGIEHLLLGLDHVLFVLGLVLLVRKLRPLVATITAFTLGHSLTLALATLGFVRMNPALTELAIAASILVLALEIARPQPDSFIRRKPWLMAAGFGLLHGLGFAGALAAVGLPQGEIPLALLAFNVGIELGQLLLVALLLVLFRLLASLPAQQRWPASATAVVAGVPPYLIGSLAACWCLERVVVLLA